jgi:hypothetical protein
MTSESARGAGETSPPGVNAAEKRRLAEIRAEEEAMQRIRKMVNDLVDERFRTLTDLIDAKAKQDSGSLQKPRSGASRRKP